MQTLLETDGGDPVSKRWNQQQDHCPGDLGDSSVLGGLGTLTISRMIGHTLDQMLHDRLAEAANGEIGIADNMLATAAMFSRADAVQATYAAAYQGEITDVDDPHMQQARQQIRAYFCPCGCIFIRRRRVVCCASGRRIGTRTTI